MKAKINKLNNDKIKAMKSVAQEDESLIYARIPSRLKLKLSRHLLDKGGMSIKHWLIATIGDL